MSKPRVLLADDHSLVLEGFRRILDDQCDLAFTQDSCTGNTGNITNESSQRLHNNILLTYQRINDQSDPLLA